MQFNFNDSVSVQYWLHNDEILIWLSHCIKHGWIRNCENLSTALRCHKLGYRLVFFILLFKRELRPSESIKVRSLALVRSFWGCFPYSAHVLFFQISYTSFAIILDSASSSCFTFAVPVLRIVSCVRYTPCTCMGPVPCSPY